jgi:hypothetical protein
MTTGGLLRGIQWGMLVPLLVQEAAPSACSRHSRSEIGARTITAHSAAAPSPLTTTHAAAAGSKPGRGTLIRTGRGTGAHGNDGDRLPGWQLARVGRRGVRGLHHRRGRRGRRRSRGYGPYRNGLMRAYDSARGGSVPDTVSG